MDNSQRTRAGGAAFVAFLACVPAANWLIVHVGTVCVPEGPCLVPVAPGILAPSGVLTVGVALVLRDVCDLPYEEIAVILDVPIGTVRSRIARGRGALADLLPGHPGARGPRDDGGNPSGGPVVQPGDRTENRTP